MLSFRIAISKSSFCQQRNNQSIVSSSKLFTTLSKNFNFQQLTYNFPQTKAINKYTTFQHQRAFITFRTITTESKNTKTTQTTQPQQLFTFSGIFNKHYLQFPKYYSSQKEVTRNIKNLENLYKNKEYAQLISYYTELPKDIQNDPTCKELYEKASYQFLELDNGASIRVDIPSKGFGVVINTPPHQKVASFIRILVNIVFLLGLLYFITNTVMSPKDLTRVLMREVSKTADSVTVRFSDVLGMDEVIFEVKTLVDYLKNPTKYNEMGARMTKGILLAGEPGTGKTLLARAIAGESGVPFFYANGSEFEELFVGLGSKRIRDLFEKAKSNAPCIIFIDEIDSLGFSRELNTLGNVRDDTLNQLLSELDGFEQNTGVIFIGATNLPDKLDKALTRPGRFDKIITVPKPDVIGRKKIIEHYLSKVKTTEEINTQILATTTIGMTGADLFNVINIAAIKAGKLGIPGVNQSLIEQAFDDVVMGLERKNKVQTEDAIKKTAFYKTGNAIVSFFSKGSDSIRKVTIISRGKSDGKITFSSDRDQTSMSRLQLLAIIRRIYGGRIGEELYTGPDNVTTGASEDYSNAYNLARKMVTEWGLSDTLGTICLTVDEENWSSEIHRMVDEEVEKILRQCYQEAKDIITMHKEEFDILCNALLKHEILSGDQVKQIIETRSFDFIAADNIIVDNKIE